MADRALRYRTSPLEEWYPGPKPPLPPPRRYMLDRMEGQEPGYPFRTNIPPRARAGRDVEDARFWLRIVAPVAFAAGYGDDDQDERKTLMWSCRLLGLPWGEITKAINDCRRFGFDAAAAVWAERMRPVDGRYVGHVYTAQADGYPEVVKVGFSTQPEKRVKALSRLHGVKIGLVSYTPGTILHEWALHQLLRHSVAPEWYRAHAVPAWLLGREAVRETA